MLAKLEMSLFMKPHIHPSKVYTELLKRATSVEMLILAMGISVQSGKAHVRGLHAMAQLFNGCFEGLSGCCSAVAAVVAKGAPYSG